MQTNGSRARRSRASRGVRQGRTARRSSKAPPGPGAQRVRPRPSPEDSTEQEELLPAHPARLPRRRHVFVPREVEHAVEDEKEDASPPASPSPPRLQTGRAGADTTMSPATSRPRAGTPSASGKERTFVGRSRPRNSRFQRAIAASHHPDPHVGPVAPKERAPRRTPSVAAPETGPARSGGQSREKAPCGRDTLTSVSGLHETYPKRGPRRDFSPPDDTQQSAACVRGNVDGRRTSQERTTQGVSERRSPCGSGGPREF